MARINGQMNYQAEATPDIIANYNTAEIQRIIPEIQRQQKTKADFIYPSPKLSVAADRKLCLSEIETFRVGEGADAQTFVTWAEAEAAAGKRSIIPQKAGGTFEMKRKAFQQLCQRTNVPVDFADRLWTENQGELASHVLTQRLQLPRTIAGSVKAADRLLVRTLDGNVRAVLSDQYLILDNIDLFFCAAQELERAGAEIWQMRLTDNNFEIVAFSKNVSGVVTTDKGMEDFRGRDKSRPGHEIKENDGGDLQYAAVRISNSETGSGGLNVDSAAMTWACRNLSVRARTLRRVHVGRIAENDGVFSDETRQAEARTTWLKVRDMIRGTFDPAKFQEWIDAMNKAVRTPITGEIEKVVPNALTKFEIDEKASAAILRKLFESRDYSQYGLSQAITYTAHVEDLHGNAEIASDLETIGGDVIRMKKTEFEHALAGAE